jgi:histidinol phosphatase-like enzyme (inositol monophosphatase family)
MTRSSTPSLSRDELAQAARVATRAADHARRETLSRFRAVAVETKADGSPVTEADRAAERAIRTVLQECYPDFGILGEEYGAQDVSDERPCWVIDPIDGTICYSRGIPLFSTLIALVLGGRPGAGGEAVVGLIDLPALDERYLGFAGGACQRNGAPVHVSRESDLARAVISHGDPFCFDRAGQRAGFERMAREIPILRGYTDAFGHSQVLAGGVDAMVDFDLNPWDVAATEVLIREAGGDCRSYRQDNGKMGIVIGSPALVEQLASFFV